jgi:hypothetical protein
MINHIIQYSSKAGLPKGNEAMPEMLKIKVKKSFKGLESTETLVQSSLNAFGDGIISVYYYSLCFRLHS